ncbi:hypothetical protein FB451DRAFT_1363064 [Mycena latifolia]|nr:hypothetical protein FB451DRAFT_1363064 [Mycena latifolia]
MPGYAHAAEAICFLEELDSMTSPRWESPPRPVRDSGQSQEKWQFVTVTDVSTSSESSRGLDLVIGNLRGDPITLRTCTLVNRDWLSTSRYHLCEALYVPHRNIQAFFDLLQCPRHTFVSDSAVFMLWDFNTTRSYSCGNFSQPFPTCERFTFYGKLLAFNDDAILPPRLPALESLGLYRAKFSSYHTLATCLLQFPSLKILKLADVTCTASPVQSPEATLRLDLDALEISLSPGIPGWLEWVAPAMGRLLRDPGLAQLNHLVFIVALEAGARLEAGSSDGAELLDGIGFAGLRRIEFWGPWDTANDILRRQFKLGITTLLPLQTARDVVDVGTHRFE